MPPGPLQSQSLEILRQKFTGTSRSQTPALPRATPGEPVICLRVNSSPWECPGQGAAQMAGDAGSSAPGLSLVCTLTSLSWCRALGGTHHLSPRCPREPTMARRRAGQRPHLDRCQAVRQRPALGQPAHTEEQAPPPRRGREGQALRGHRAAAGLGEVGQQEWEQ